MAMSTAPIAGMKRSLMATTSITSLMDTCTTRTVTTVMITVRSKWFLKLRQHLRKHGKTAGSDPCGFFFQAIVPLYPIWISQRPFKWKSQRIAVTIARIPNTR